MNLYFPRFDHQHHRVLAVYRYPGEKVCARIHSRPMHDILLRDVALGLGTPEFERRDRDTGAVKTLDAEQLLAAMALYYDRPDALLDHLRRDPKMIIGTPRFDYRAIPAAALSASLPGESP